MKRRSPLKQTPLRPMSGRREEELRDAGTLQPGSTFAASSKPTLRTGTPLPGTARQVRPADTGPDRNTVDAALERAGHCCERCGGGLFSDRRGIDWSAHHRKLRSQGVDNSLSNIVILCGHGTSGCHGWAHANPTQARAEGWLVGRDEDPRLKPIPHALHGFVFLAADGTWSSRRPGSVEREA